MKKLLLSLLVIAMLITAFAACDEILGIFNEESTTEGTTPEETGSEAEIPEGLQDAKDYLEALYKDQASSTPSDYTVVGKLRVDGVDYSLTWTVDNDAVKVVKVDETKVTIDVNEKSTEEVKYVLTATITDAKNNTVTCSFNRSVPAYKINTWAEYAAAENDELLVVQGVVTGIISKSNDSSNNCLYIQDDVGGYYVYGLTEDPLEQGIKVGMTVEAKGKKDNYNGTLELKEASVTIVDETIKTVTPVDYTDLYKNAETLTDTALVEKQGLLVTIKGVELLAQTADDVSGNYYRFKIGEQASSYVRISGSTCPINKTEQDAFKASFAEHVGYVADVTGVICVYNGAFYLTPVTADAYVNFAMPERTDKEKAEFELNGLEFINTVTSDSEVDLVTAGTTYTNVTFTWASSDETAAVVSGNKVTFKVPDEAVEVKLTVTATCGAETATKDFIVKLSKIITPLKDAIEIGNTFEKNEYSEGKYLIAGIITELQNDKYGNVIITDETGASILVYGLYDATGENRYDVLETKPVVGDYIVVLGIIGKYNDPQMKNGWIVSHVTETSLKDAIDLGNTFEKNKYSEDKYLVTGEISEVQNDKYGNVVIKDAEGNSILVYGLYSSNGEVRYDAMETKPVVGDTITVLGVVGKYNDPQFKNAWLIAHAAAAGEGTESGSGSEDVTEGKNDTTVEGGVKYVFSEYETGAQYAENEEHVLDSTLKVTTNQAHFNGQIRLYHSEANEYVPDGRHATAIFESTKVINAISINAGNKADTLVVSGSVDGTTWTVIQSITVAEEYADFNVAIENSTYKFIKLEPTAKQIRVASVTVVYAE